MALFSPVESPWILDNPGTFIGKSYSKNSMIDISFTVTEDTTSILTPVWSINQNWNWIFSDIVLNIIFISSDILTSTNSSLSSVEFASLVDCLIWVFWLECKTIGSNVVNGIIIVTTWASEWFGITVIQLLFSKIYGCALFDVKEGFSWSDSRESPTWSTLSLILNFGNSSPIFFTKVFSWWFDSWLSVHHSFWCSCSQIDLSEFFLGKVWEFGLLKEVSLAFISIVFSNNF